MNTVMLALEVLGVVLGVVLILMAFLFMTEIRALGWRGRLMLGATFLVGFALVSPPFFWESVPGGVVLLDYQQNILRVFPERSRLRQKEFDELTKQGKFYFWDRGIGGSVKLNIPLSGRDEHTHRLTVVVKAQLVTRPEAVAAFIKRIGEKSTAANSLGWNNWEGGGYLFVTQSIQTLVAYEVNEFVKAKNKELVTLYNPIDGAQQERFRQLFVSFSGEKLSAEGIMVTAAYFEI